MKNICSSANLHTTTQVMAICQICNENVSKYKCPKCKIGYCSLSCFKSPEHNHETLSATDPKTDGNDSKQSLVVTSPENTFSRLKPRSQRILKNDKRQHNGKLRALLELPQLQVQLLVLHRILTDPSVTNEQSFDARKDIAIKKLETLREDGVHANELVEEFCTVFEMVAEGANE